MQAADAMRVALRRRFGGCLQFDHTRLATIYAAATYLDRRYRRPIFLSRAQLHSAKEYLISESSMPTLSASIVTNIDVDRSNTIIVNEATDAISDQNKFSASSLMAAYCETEHRIDENDNMAMSHPLFAEFTVYESYPPLQLNEKSSPIDFWNWMQENGQTPILSAIALDILSIPASSASVERLFSAAGRAKNAVRSCLGPAGVEAECLIRLNQMLLDE